MEQKVNPHGLRVGIIKDWDSQWYEDSEFADYEVNANKSNLKIGKIRDWDSILAIKNKMRRFNSAKLTRFIRAVIGIVKKGALPRQRVLI